MNVFAALISPPVLRGIPKQRKPNRHPSLRVRTPEKAQKIRGLPVVDTPWDLTPHQVLILRHLSEGLSNEEIAGAIGLKPKTVEIHVHNLYDRMQAHVAAPMNRVRAALMWERFTNGRAE